MKKVLFATTALVMTAGYAAADVSLSGSATVGLKGSDAPGADAFLHQEIDLDINFSGTADNGLSFGASMDLDENATSSDPQTFVSGAFGTVTMGDVDIATDGLGLPDLGFDGIGMDDDVEALRNAGAADVTYGYSVGDFGILLSVGVGTTAGTDASEGDYGLLLSYSFDAFSIEAGIAENDVANGPNTRGMGIEAGYSANGLSATVLWTQQDAAIDTTGYGVNVAYTIDALTVSASYGDTDAVGDFEDYGVGFSYNLGGGLKIAGAVGSVNDVNVWDLGLNMSF